MRSLEGREPLPRQREGLRVTVNANDVQLRKTLQHGLGVAAHAKRGVHDDGGPSGCLCCFDGRSEQIDAAVPQDGYVPVLCGTVFAHWSLLPLLIRCSGFLDQIPIRASRYAWLRGR